MFRVNRFSGIFIPTYFPWYGGVHESMVGVVKRCLERSLQGCIVSADKLRTVLCQVMDIVNSRPLTYMPEGEVVELITPTISSALGESM